jgi:hypothetical protein
VHGELLVPGVKVAASTVWEILHDAGIPVTAENLIRAGRGPYGFVAARNGLQLILNMFSGTVDPI